MALALLAFLGTSPASMASGASAGEMSILGDYNGASMPCALQDLSRKMDHLDGQPTTPSGVSRSAASTVADGGSNQP